MAAGSTKPEPLPADTEERLGKFTELLAAGIANAESRAGLARLAEEQAALRRVATLVAHGAPPNELFAAVVEEVRQVLPIELVAMARYESDDTMTNVATAGPVGDRFPVGGRWRLSGKNVSTIVAQTGCSARIDSYADASGAVGVAVREQGLRSSVGTPIIVEGRLWGVMTAASRAEQPLPADTEARLGSFTEVVATAIANAESRAALAASRMRIVAASDETRRRIERDLHDGIQQHLVSLGLELRLAESTASTEARGTIGRAAGAVAAVTEELREISRGIHPAILSEGGLGPALRTLARRSAIPIQFAALVDRRLPEPIEVAAYYVVSEALTNATKHANASQVNIDAAARDSSLRLSIRDDGVGGADPARGSGLVGLCDRVEALGGTIDVESRAGVGTAVVVAFPLDHEASAPS
jgi:signal transduction histidine kinase